MTGRELLSMGNEMRAMIALLGIQNQYRPSVTSRTTKIARDGSFSSLLLVSFELPGDDFLPSSNLCRDA